MEKSPNLAWRGKISIDQVLAEIRENPAGTFWLAFVRASGRERGSIKVVPKCLYGAPRKNHEKVIGGVVGRQSALHTEKGTLPMTDYETGNYLTPLISHIVGYNLYQVIH